MAILSWGKYTLEKTTSTSGTPGSTWTAIDTPVDGSGTLTPTDGDEVEAKEEGGEVVDSRRSKTKYTFEWDNFIKKGGTRPFTDEDGVITGEYALRITPEDSACEGIQIDRCVITAKETFTSADGKKIHYTAKVLKPASGAAVKAYTYGSSVVGTP